ncbi:ankyrin repeat domain-containing protein [Winogradskyella helgolandensis]|uniref:ankyrin repeat domain-containing protein n=1 Tax=Winogradskyella helgolandensis TaxID=2697010 RepID=UPI0015B97F21|nr:ankyrin repeat domain-containing protein [Winogradskyella helgolandensis]
MKHLFFIFLLAVTSLSLAQSIPNDIKNALKSDDATAFSKLVTVENIKVCYEAGNSNYSLLALSIKLKAEKCFETLLSKKADLEQACSSKTPLMYAVKYGHLEMVKALVKAGADYKAENNSGRTATDYAKKYEQKEIYDYLKELKK